ncbi:hypothetical protein NDU88_010256 [Pleurodeles waltl]|uniref:Uncharacterized protein n=1 Tax=Pleurodeles waltl TaxID=8319 RepID=A0AAV7S241_PLEWA|nr:hypothetical protein NDU88_010256 [Pleurodeles waltl]
MTTPSTALSTVKILSSTPSSTTPSMVALRSETTPSTVPSSTPLTKKKKMQSASGWGNITPGATSPSKITPLIQTHLLEDDSDDDGPFEAAHSPSQLHVKCQEDDEEYYHQYYSPQRQLTYVPEEMVCVPSSLISDLQFLLSDYKRRFPSGPQPDIQTAPPPSMPATPVPQPRASPRSTRSTPQRSFIKVTDSSDEEREEGELQDNSDWGS